MCIRDRLDHDRALRAGRQIISGLVHDAYPIAGHRQGRRPRLGRQRFDPPGAGHDRPPGLGLPPVVDHRHAEQVTRPAVGLRVQPLAGEEEQAQGAHVVRGKVFALRIFLADRTQRGRRGEHAGHAMLGGYAPEGSGVRCADRLALVEHGGRPGQQRRVDDVRVPDHPSDVGRRPERLPRAYVEDVLHRPPQRDRVPAVVADHALGAAGRPGGVEDVERVGRADRHALGGFRVSDRFRPGQVSFLEQFGGLFGALQDHPPVRDVGGRGEGGVQHRLVGDGPPGLDPARRRDDHFRTRVVDPGRQLASAEAAEDHRVHRAQPSAGEHRDDRLRHHRHVDHDPIATGDPEPAQCPCEDRDLVLELRVRVGPRHPRDRAVVDQRRLLPAPLLDVPVQCAPRDP